MCGCRSEPAQPPPPRIVLVVVDTLRADRLGVLGASPSPTPALDRLAETAAVFTAAQTTAPFTMPAVASLMTGVYPDRLGLRNHSTADRLPDGRVTLADLARRHGYRTAAVVTNPWLARPSSGFRRGFDQFLSGRTKTVGGGEERGPHSWRMSADRVAEAAVALLNHDATTPLFLWVHFMDTHMPYAVNARVAAERGVPSTSSAPIRNFSAADFDRQKLYFREPEAKVLAATRSLYDTAVETVDRQIARIIASLDADDIVVVASDHGESLGEHGLFFAHDFTLYQELLHVPLIVRLPGRPSSRIAVPVSLLDVVPTLCAELGWTCPSDFDGRALPLQDSETASSPRDLFSVSAPFREKYNLCPFLEVPGPAGRWSAVRRDDRKLIRVPTRDGIRYEAYDLARDPSENVNVYSADADAELVEVLGSWFAGQSATDPPRFKPGDADPDTVRELRALGYVD